MAQHRASVSYLPGRWVALASDHAYLIAELEPGAPILAACWEAVERGADADTLLGVILREGLRTVPSFAIAERTDNGLRILVSGKAQAEIAAPEQPDPVVVSAAEAPTWIEHRVEGSPDFRLVGESVAQPPGTQLPLSGGIVLASTISVGTPGLVATPRASAPPVGPGQINQPPPPPVAEPVAPTIAVAPVDVPAAADASPSLPWLDTAAADAPEPEPASGPTTANFLAYEESGQREVGSPPPSRSAASDDTMYPPPQDQPLGVPPVIDSLPWRVPEAFRQDLTPPPGTGAPNPQQQPPQQPPPDPGHQLPQWGPVPHEPAPFQPPSYDQPSYDQPGYAPPSFDQPGYAPPGPPGGGMPFVQETVERSALPDQDPTAAPLVHAVGCPNQHLNPPYADTCRVCSARIPRQDAFTAPRPLLGVLVLSTGDTVPLDRDVVLGRAPFHADTTAQSRPHLVQLASPGNDISRSHVRVSLEGWHVQVTDLGSTNGTVVTLPGQAPVRLRAHDPFTIVAGTSINVADEVHIRFEIPS